MNPSEYVVFISNLLLCINLSLREAQLVPLKLEGRLHKVMKMIGVVKRTLEFHSPVFWCQFLRRQDL